MIPLQRRPHKLCYLSGRLDLSRISREIIKRSEAARRATAIIDGRVDDEWDFREAAKRVWAGCAATGSKLYLLLFDWLL